MKSKNNVKKLIIPGTDEWTAATERPLPLVGSKESAVSKPVVVRLKRKKKVKRWAPNYRDKFYSFERRAAQIMVGPDGSIYTLSDDGRLFMFKLFNKPAKGVGAWIELPELPRRWMKQ